VFGGWDSANQKDCYFIKEEGPDKFAVFQEDECRLNDPDIFLFTGALRIDTEKN